MLMQLKLARDWCIKVAESCPKELAMIQLEEFNNTILWQVGHVLTAAERIMFSLEEQSTFLSEKFTHWFDYGTSPSEWNDEVPEMAELIHLLHQQRTRLLSIQPETFNNQLSQPKYGFTIYGECAGFVAVHEALHVGKMEEMLRVIRHKMK